MDPAAPSSCISIMGSAVSPSGDTTATSPNPGMKVPPPELSCLELLWEATGICRSQQLHPVAVPTAQASPFNPSASLPAPVFSPVIPAGFGSRFKGLLERWECEQSCDTSRQRGLRGKPRWFLNQTRISFFLVLSSVGCLRGCRFLNSILIFSVAGGWQRGTGGSLPMTLDPLCLPKPKTFIYQTFS